VLHDLGPRAVIVVARMIAAERYKGHDQLLEAWPLVAARFPDARLVLAGTGDDVPRLKAKAAALGLGSKAIFTGFVSRPVLTSLYQHAAVFAMPSREEGFGLVYLEAMVHGLPCIGSIHDAAGDVIEDGKTGFLVDQANTEELADRLLCLLSDGNRRAEMGAAGRRRVEQHFTYERFRQRLLGLLHATFGPLEPSWLDAGQTVAVPAGDGRRTDFPGPAIG
jgi:phosphatidylinositol alpha-1,6-mannosyltransferase